jgi:hypothetical protein
MSIRKKWGREIAEMTRAYMLQSKVQPDPLWKEEEKKKSKESPTLLECIMFFNNKNRSSTDMCFIEKMSPSAK